MTNVPALPDTVLAMELLPRIPLRERLRLRGSTPDWNNRNIIFRVHRVVLMNRQLAEHRNTYDYDLKRHNMDRLMVSTNQMARANEFLQSCRNLRSLILWRLSLDHLVHLSAIAADVFARLRRLELFYCEEQVNNQQAQYVVLIGNLLAIPHYLRVFRYTAVHSYMNMGQRVQTLLDNNPELQVLKIYERDAQFPWNLQFRTHLRSLHMRVNSTDQFWTSLRDTSRYWLTSFTSELHRPLHDQIIRVLFPSLRKFRAELTQDMMAAMNMQFPQQHLTTLAVLDSINVRNYETFLVIENRAKLTILDLGAVVIDSEDAFHNLCHSSPLLRIFRFSSTHQFTFQVMNDLCSLHFLEELQILMGACMYPEGMGTIPAMLEAMDSRVAQVAHACTRLRVLVCGGGTGQQTVAAMREKALAHRRLWFFIDLDNTELYDDYPDNLKWIKRYHWQTVFSGFEGNYFDWKILKDGRT